MVQKLLQGAIISAVNYAEVVTRLSVLGMPENEILEALEILGLEIIPFDEEQSFRAGILVNVTRPYGLSLGDRACLALALKSRLPAVTSDRAWQDVKAGLDVRLIR
jgi:PIN domain nuclease of toxin-antitoxin system